MQKLFILLLSIYFSNNIFSQSVRPSSNNTFLFPQGNPIGELNSFGTSGLYNSVSNIGSINPAALNNFDDISFGFAYQFETNINEAWIVNIGYKRHTNFIPQSAGVLIPYKNFRIGLSTRQGYNGIMDLGLLEVSTIQNPDGTGEFIDLQITTILYDYSLLASYSIKNIIDDWNLSIGGKFTTAHMTNELLSFGNISLNFNGNYWTGGLMLEKRYETNKYIQFGLLYEKDLNLTEHQDGGITATPISDSSRPAPYVIAPPSVAQFPARLKFDFDISMVPDFKFLGCISNIYWNNIDSGNPNEIEYSGSVVYDFSDKVSSSVGFYSTRKEYSPSLNTFFNINKSLQAFFITLGTDIKINNLSIDISLADSHLLSGVWRKQTVGKIGIGYEIW